MATNPEDIEAARRQGKAEAEALAEHAPDDPILRVAWADGIGDADHVRDAVSRARTAGASWKDIGDALGISHHTARNRFNPSGYEGQRRYRERKKQGGEM